jgi:hypothetical protein
LHGFSKSRSYEVTSR